MFKKIAHSLFIFLLLLTISILAGAGCSSDEEEPEEILIDASANTPNLTEQSTFQLIQTNIFDANCANSACHAITRK